MAPKEQKDENYFFHPVIDQKLYFSFVILKELQIMCACVQVCILWWGLV